MSILYRFWHILRRLWVVHWKWNDSIDGDIAYTNSSAIITMAMSSIWYKNREIFDTLFTQASGEKRIRSFLQPSPAWPVAYKVT